MANPQSATGLSKFGDLKNRLLFLLGALVVFRIGSHIPVPGVDGAALTKLYESAGGGILSMLNMFSGGSLQRFSIFAIGVMPYISASIIVQLASEIIPSLKALKKEGEAGRRTLTKYTRYGTVLLATLQSFGAAAFVYQQNVVVSGQFEFYLTTMVCLVTGTMFLMWLGEQITERGIGNGISLIITAGIAASLPAGIGRLLTLTSQGSISYLMAVALIVGALALIYAVVYIESAQRKVPVQYAKRQVGNRIMQAQNSHLPFKLNMAGVIPPIFASSIILFPSTLLSWFGSANQDGWLQKLATLLQHGQPVYILLFAATIIFFCYFYTALVFSPREMAENLKKSGAFVPGIRPGEQTSRYLEKVVLRLTFWGAIYIAIVCLIPEVLTSAMNVPFYLGGTSLLILVVVTMDFKTQIASYVMSSQYEHLMKRSAMKSLSSRR
ncbi:MULTISPECIES: preprotein translocase subunit SecY [Snodgrassella]|uniref:Protein translocase subunit SecY n=1 Tax=Snodgrassella alvi TaxID=1196083 RepID=A0A2N9X9G3_9NEIS|nr:MULTISPECIES: preprotein translocase subunit SecY [Snodgrassella]MCX8746999.1 preprotein translocase subunit SecY [Snodgrassella sp. B3800]MCX8748762.1 preprotein translocase subunit SecY [Snodgrassella sp. B3088]MCX8753335.1 preprotein translocase subunit SecY [Snodgrassella sp. B3837]PIT39078.1 preprotein translocase subunit SecY [Snodgrassella alvi]PIT41485.1 preprotein translocase subunit SecY [Snodgrassella alvi]